MGGREGRRKKKKKKKKKCAVFEVEYLGAAP